MNKTDRKQFVRVLVVCLLLLGSAMVIHNLDTSSARSIKKPLSTLPGSIGQWESRGRDQAMEENVVSKLNVDDYIFRNYHGPEGETINLYASYFAYTDRVKGYHSPLNCMPGSGWQVTETSEVSIPLDDNSGGMASVTRLILQKGSRHQVVFYWYQCRGRIIDNEYEERIYRVLDSIFKGRTDGSFIRLIAGDFTGSAEYKSAMLKDFAEKMIPLLWNYIPE